MELDAKIGSQHAKNQCSRANEAQAKEGLHQKDQMLAVQHKISIGADQFGDVWENSILSSKLNA